jgi:hypothetical protein
MSTIVISEDNLTLDDFLQLQSLLNHEQGECDKHIEACYQQNKPHIHPGNLHPHAIKFRRAINPQAAHESQLEKKRLAHAILTLQYLKDQYRRQRAAQIQAYLEEYRRQALIRAVLQEEEERYYRQCIAAALEQRRVNLLWQQFVDAKRQEALVQQLQNQQVNEKKEQAIEDKTDDDNDDEGYSEYHSQQLANLLKQIFNLQHPEQDITAEDLESETATNVNVINNNKSEDEQQSMAEVWKYLNEQKADSETPRTAFFSSEHDQVLGAGKEQNSESNEQSSGSNEQNSESNEQNSEFNEQQETESIGSPASLSDNDQIKALPPLQDHVITLQDLIQKLAAEPVLVGEQYNKYDAPIQSFTKEPLREATPPPPTITTTTNENKDDETEKSKEKTKKAFLPQHILTEAEPTPTLENMPNTPLDNVSIKDDSHFVDTIAAEQQNQETPADPRKKKALEELDHISDQLSNNSDLVKRWNQVLLHSANLSFTRQQEGTLLLTASTDANRQFLGSEDEIMRVMLKLDSIDSLGDEDVRLKRKSLVKKCEHMLEELDQVKKTQWEKVVSSNKHRKNKHRRRNKKHHKK